MSFNGFNSWAGGACARGVLVPDSLDLLSLHEKGRILNIYIFLNEI
jgi:hypothetical protein